MHTYLYEFCVCVYNRLRMDIATVLASSTRDAYLNMRKSIIDHLYNYIGPVMSLTCSQYRPDSATLHWRRLAFQASATYEHIKQVPSS